MERGILPSPFSTVRGMLCDFWKARETPYFSVSQGSVILATFHRWCWFLRQFALKIFNKRALRLPTEAIGSRITGFRKMFWGDEAKEVVCNDWTVVLLIRRGRMMLTVGVPLPEHLQTETRHSSVPLKETSGQSIWCWWRARCFSCIPRWMH